MYGNLHTMEVDVTKISLINCFKFYIVYLLMSRQIEVSFTVH
jgi:hypothetical protein